MAPIEDFLAKSHTDLPPAAAGQLEVVDRNGLRVLRLVNTLLAFSRIEAGRVRAVYQPTDFAGFTAELASVFRAAVERARLRHEDSHVELRVRDTGTGIPAQKIPKLFERFHRIENARGPRGSKEDSPGCGYTSVLPPSQTGPIALRSQLQRCRTRAGGWTAGTPGLDRTHAGAAVCIWQAHTGQAKGEGERDDFFDRPN